MKPLATLLATLTLLVAPAMLHAQVRLEHKFPDGRKTTVNKYVKVEQTLTIAGMDIPSTSEQNITTTEISGTRQADGTLASKQKIESLQATLAVAGMELQFDSVNPNADPPGTALDAVLDIFKAVANSSWTVTLGQDNRVLSVKGHEDALDDLPAELRAAVAKQFDPEHLVEQANQELEVLADEAVKQGDTWKREASMQFDSYQSMTFTTVYEYAGTIVKDGKSLDRITAKTTDVSYAMSGDSPSPLKIVDSDLKVIESSGTILFDRAAGMIVETTDKKHIAGSMKCDINGTEVPGKLDLVLETTTNRS